MNDASFLSQLEQRTQRVKITLANLEAERVRIAAVIARLQPLVPHYDALLAAERAIDESRIELDELTGEPPREETESFAPEHLRSEHSGESVATGEEPRTEWQAPGEGTSESAWGG